MANPDFIQTPRKPIFRRTTRRRLIIAGIAAGFFILLVLIAGRPARNAIRAWQARKHAERAMIAIDQQDWTKARNEATAAYQLQPNEPEAVRSVARFLSRIGQIDGLEFWKKMAATAPLTVTDLRDETQIALKANDLATASDAVEKLLAQPNHQDTAADCLLAADVASRRHNYRKAATYDQRALADPNATRPEQLRATLNLDKIVRAGGRMFVEDRKKIDDSLVALAAGDDQTSLDALTALGQMALSQPDATKTDLPIAVADLEHKIDTHPRATITSHLLATDLEISQHNSNRQEIERSAVDRWKNSSNEDVAVLGGWLYGHGEFEHELDLIPLNRAVQSRDLFLARIDALAALQRWGEIQKLLESERYPLEPVVQNMYLALCYTKQGQQISADNSWQRAIESAAGDLPKLLAVGSLAERNGVASVAATAYDAAAAASPKSLEAQLGRLRVIRASNDTHKIHSVVADMLKIWPNDPNFQNDELYLRLLLLPADTNPESAELKSIQSSAEKMMKDQPNSFPHRTVLALALLKEHQPNSALALYRNLTVTGSAISPSTIAIHAAVLGASGQTDEAKAEAAKVPTDKLLPEEKRLLASP